MLNLVPQLVDQVLLLQKNSQKLRAHVLQDPELDYAAGSDANAKDNHVKSPEAGKETSSEIYSSFNFKLNPKED